MAGAYATGDSIGRDRKARWRNVAGHEILCTDSLAKPGAGIYRKKPEPVNQKARAGTSRSGFVSERRTI